MIRVEPKGQYRPTGMEVRAMSTRGESLTGGCFCGAIRYEADTEPLMMVACHCRDCQKSIGGAYFPAVAVPATVLRVQGDPRTYAAKGDSGSTVTRAFCGQCGTSLWAWTSMMPES